MLGETVSHYRIIEKLGQGGMGEVYLAEDTRLGRKVALKFLAPELTRDRESLARFRNEAKAVAELSHPNIATIHDIGDAGGKPFLALEYVRGQTLRARIAQGPLPIEDVLRIGKALAAGMAQAHSRGIVHRDIKSANVMLSDEGEVKILDFGLARRADATQITRAGTTLGTIAYMSPEQVQGQETDERSDLWSVGVVLYECLTGTLPFRGETDAVFAQIKSAEAPAPRSLRSGIPVELDQLILRCLEKDRAQRFQAADDLVAAMRAMESTRLSTPLAKESSHSRHSIRLWVLGILAAFVLILVWQRPWNSGLDSSSRPRAPIATSPPRVVPLLSEDALESAPAWSPTGNLICYAAHIDGTADIWLCDVDGSNPINLTRSPDSIDDYPAWSPDGQSIVFYSDRDGPGIYTMTVTGGNVRRVRDVDPALPENGLFVIQWVIEDIMVFADSSDDGRPDTFLLDLDTGEVECLTSSSAEGAHIGRINREQTLLAYRRPWLGVDAELYVLDLGTQRAHPLPIAGRNMQWAPGGDALYVVSSVDGASDLWVQRVDPESGIPEGEPQKLTTALSLRDLSWHPDGTRAVASQAFSTSNVWVFPTESGAPPELQTGMRLTNDSFSRTVVRWLPDGSGYIDVSERRGSMNAWITDLNTGHHGRVSEDRAYAAVPSPDGNWFVLAVVNTDGTSFPYVMRKDGSEHRELYPSLREQFLLAGVFAWSRDGNHLALHVKQEDGFRIGVAGVDLETATVHSFQLLPFHASIPFFSPDGQHLVYQGNEDGQPDLFITDLAGSEVHRLTNTPAKEWVSGWEAEPSAIYFKVGDTDDAYRVAMGSGGRPRSEPELWFSGSGPIVVQQWLDFHQGRAIGPMAGSQSDLWLMEFRDATSR